MNDPWHVKSTKLSHQYVSCMKINGSSLLPPVLSKECRKEMQYYKLLAKEVERRISILQPYVDNSSDLEDKEQDIDKNDEKILLRDFKANYDTDEQKASLINAIEPSLDVTECISSEPHSNIKSSFIVSTTEGVDTTKFVIDLSLTINESNKIIEAVKQLPQYIPVDIPERDYNESKSTEKELTYETKEEAKEENNDLFLDAMEQTSHFAMDVKEKKDIGIASPSFQSNIQKYSFNHSPTSFSSKSFTGSLIDIHYETSKETDSDRKLIRQRSYTVLEPSPQLLAHLEQQSMKTGVNVTAISMSEADSKQTSPGKKRKGWDLESAKETWSSMANELNRNKACFKSAISSRSTENKAHMAGTAHVSRQVEKRTPPVTHTTSARAQLVAKDLTVRNGLNPKASPKSDPLPVQKIKNQVNYNRNVSASKTFVIECDPNTSIALNKTSTALRKRSPDASDSEDPATKVKQLYEKIQKQQLLQMANLVEKQKREQMMLQKVFEEQNTTLFKQLKTICPKSPIEIKAAWEDKSENRGPVSLRQVINHKQNSTAKHVSSTLNETSNFINHCEDVLKKSKDLTCKINKRTPKNSRAVNGNSGKATIENTPPPSSPKLEGSRTRTHSPNHRNTARKLNYDASVSFEQALTDRTNDTLADLNVTFTTDEDDFSGKHRPSKTCPRTPTILSPQERSSPHFQSNDSTLKRSQITNSSKTCRSKQKNFGYSTPQEVAAATTIVAYAKGYLVRRLMQTERVQTTVQMIKDALLCALELHQDREGIRGADVDLHRRLIQQITAACYSLHDAFVASAPAERCALIAADRARRLRTARAQRQSTPVSRGSYKSDAMSQSHSGAFPARVKRPHTGLMSQSSYETFSSGVKGVPRRPWR